MRNPVATPFRRLVGEGAVRYNIWCPASPNGPAASAVAAPWHSKTDHRPREGKKLPKD